MFIYKKPNNMISIHLHALSETRCQKQKLTQRYQRFIGFSFLFSSWVGSAPTFLTHFSHRRRGKRVLELLTSVSSRSLSTRILCIFSVLSKNSGKCQSLSIGWRLSAVFCTQSPLTQSNKQRNEKLSVLVRRFNIIIIMT